MANNRIWLRCGLCGGRICAFKYYPSDGWYLFRRKHEIDQWMEDHRHEDQPTMHGPTHFYFGYEHTDESSHMPEIDVVIPGETG